ncbi:hypothetical protein Bca52824_048575 [Brassica carinata]|uniref:Uncharacterized protein n=1 Tax=Brassica carinata TaxID=52824 RepID=A0A8X7RIN6_BRACI|nr:hypothetical protein Bca52824_048575 [Brassica carinata]
MSTSPLWTYGILRVEFCRYNTIRNIKSFTERIKGSGSQRTYECFSRIVITCNLCHYENYVIRGSNSIEQNRLNSTKVLLTEGTDNRDDKTHQGGSKSDS